MYAFRCPRGGQGAAFCWWEHMDEAWVGLCACVHAIPPIVRNRTKGTERSVRCVQRAPCDLLTQSLQTLGVNLPNGKWVGSMQRKYRIMKPVHLSAFLFWWERSITQTIALTDLDSKLSLLFILKLR
jgi:hypothetical protein